MLPPEQGDIKNFSDIFIVTEMMDTDLDQATSDTVTTFFFQLLVGLDDDVIEWFISFFFDILCVR